MMELQFFDVLDLNKAHVKAHFRRDSRTGKLVFIKDHSAQRHGAGDAQFHKGDTIRVTNPKSKHNGKEFEVLHYSDKYNCVRVKVPGQRHTADFRPEHIVSVNHLGHMPDVDHEPENVPVAVKPDDVIKPEGGIETKTGKPEPKLVVNIEKPVEKVVEKPIEVGDSVTIEKPGTKHHGKDVEVVSIEGDSIKVKLSTGNVTTIQSQFLSKKTDTLQNPNGETPAEAKKEAEVDAVVEKPVEKPIEAAPKKNIEDLRELAKKLYEIDNAAANDPSLEKYSYSNSVTAAYQFFGIDPSGTNRINSLSQKLAEYGLKFRNAAVKIREMFPGEKVSKPIEKPIEKPTPKPVETPPPKSQQKLFVNLDKKETPKKDVDKIEDFGEKVGGARKDVAERGFTKVTAKKGDGAEPAWKKKFKVMESVRYPGKWSVVQVSKNRWGGASSQQFSSQEEAETALPLFAVAQSFYADKGQDGTWEIVKKVGDRKRLTMTQKKFASREDAMKHMAANAEELLNTKTTFGEEILPIPDKVNRKGVVRRNGPATREMFIETFSPRAIEFGNWNNQEERQLLMNNAYDGLLDLSDTMGVDPKALMLNGELAIAFGARGIGLSVAKAHYEPDYGIINLTKMKGAGSLAHEWMHAFDHYLARLDTKASSEKKLNERGDLVFDYKRKDTAFQSHGPSYKSKMRPELKDAYDNVMKTMLSKAKQYVVDTQTADKFLSIARDYTKKSLDDVRAELAADRTNYAKAKGGWRRSEKGLHPASAEQLAEFDRLAALIVEGGDVNVERKYTEPKKRGRFATFGSAYHTNNSIDAIGEIFKTVRGNNGRIKDGGGIIDKVATATKAYSERLKMFDEAQKGTEKTKQVPTDFALEAKKMDQARSGDYWSEPHEMVARAFASYVEDKVAEKGGQSDFLVYQAHGGIFLPMIDGFVARPYPEGKEREAINSAFDKFIKTINVQETDKGVAMFKRNNPGDSGAHVDHVKSSVNSVLDKFKGINSDMVQVFQSENEFPKSLRAEIARQRAQGKFYAVMHNKKIYFAADNMKPSDATEMAVVEGLMRHEGRHWAMDQIFQNKRAKERFFKSASVIHRKEALAYLEKNNMPVNDKNLAIAAEEVIVDQAVSGKKGGMVDRFISKVSEWLRKVFPKLSVSNTEIRDLLRRSDKKIESKQAVGLGQIQGN